MTNMLPQLDDGVPVMRSKHFSAVVALPIPLSKFNDLWLLNLDFVTDLLLYLYLHFDSFRVRLSPDELGWAENDFVESFYFFEEKGHHFLAFSLAENPWWSFVAMAISTIYYFLCWGKGVLILKIREGASITYVAIEGSKFGAAKGAEDSGLLLRC